MGTSAIIVLGMHRSGTSALAGMLSLAGADPGPSLIPAEEGVNPKGFWEHEGIVDIHERLLEAIGSSWNDDRPLPEGWWRRADVEIFRNELLDTLSRDFSHSKLWVLKDPRICRLLPLWKRLLRDCGISPLFVICVRHPREVAMSLEQRNGIQDDRACLLWLEHLIDSERETRGMARIMVTYEQLLADWRGVLRQVGTNLSMNLELDRATEGKIESFIEPALRHHNQPPIDQLEDDSMKKLAFETYSLVTSEGIDSLAARTDNIKQGIDARIRCVAAWSTEIYNLRKANTDMQLCTTELQVLRAEITRIKSTASWRITKPLRGIGNILLRPLRRGQVEH